MWPYSEEENVWLTEKPEYRVKSHHYDAELPEYYRPETVLADSIDFHRQRAHELRNEAIGHFFGGIANEAATVLRQLGQLTSGHHGKVEAAINELRKTVTPRNA
ncbi:hypothetical protein [Dongia sp.]|uniref:hypothetical protein n=1 Tax=Dongia sp. TaxID=1977262 RepID=UPI0035ADCE6F